MSREFLNVRVLELDTSHKRVRGQWLELTLGEWRNDLNRSVTLARVFWDSQSAAALCHALELVWAVIKEDTGRVPLVRHLSTEEERLSLVLLELILLDDHKGQALGVGLFLVKLAAALGERVDLFEPLRRLSDLGAYDHLRRIIWLCCTHYIRHVRPFHGKECEDVYRAMLSLASADPLPDFEALVRLIKQKGSKEANQWLAEKELSDRSGLRALYQPLSFIPVQIWKSGPSSTNARESAQGRDILSGKGLNLVGGLVTAWFDDRDEMRSFRSHLNFGISRHYTEPTVAHRAMTSLVRNAKQGKRVSEEADLKISVALTNIAVLQNEISNAEASLSTAGDASTQIKRQRLHDSALQRLSDETSRLPALVSKGSGRISVSQEALSGQPSGSQRPVELVDLFKTREELAKHLKGLKIQALKPLCKQRNVKVTGRKEELINRLLDVSFPLQRGTALTTANDTAGPRQEAGSGAMDTPRSPETPFANMDLTYSGPALNVGFEEEPSWWVNGELPENLQNGSWLLDMSMDLGF
ncbi:hypothetical protein AURDEDRAFT_175844 [Auricularia subglabra TFB-10046 SS5]|nr:hypothetical protein AURDEDRAFT_175844 [Auricularia subglabra TFB-10046 SS5]